MAKALAFLFPGQGSQSVGMGADLWEKYAVAKSTLDQADKSLGNPLSELIARGPKEELTKTFHAQPAILTVSVAIGRVLQEKGLQPTIMAGHSLGEYSALVLSGAMTFEDAVRIVRQRGCFMQEAVPLGTGTMSAILGLKDDVVENVCAEVSSKGLLVEPANYNCPGQVVVSGANEGVAAAVEILKQKGAKRCVPLSVSAPFHCSLLKPAAEKLEKELEKIDLSDPKIPYIANVDCTAVRLKEEIKQRLVDQVFKPVRWTQTLQQIVREHAPNDALEVGPGNVVMGHLKKVDSNIGRHFTDTPESLEAACQL